MTTGPSISKLGDSGPSAMQQPLRLMIYAVLLTIATLFVLTSLRASAPGYAPVAQADDRPLALPDR